MRYRRSRGKNASIIYRLREHAVNAQFDTEIIAKHVRLVAGALILVSTGDLNEDYHLRTGEIYLSTGAVAGLQNALWIVL